MTDIVENILKLLDTLGESLKEVLILSESEDLNPELEEAIENLKKYCTEHENEIPAVS